MYYEVSNNQSNDQVLPLSRGNVLIKHGKKGYFKDTEITPRDLKILTGCRMNVRTVAEKGERQESRALLSQAMSIEEAPSDIKSAEARSERLALQEEMPQDGEEVTFSQGKEGDSGIPTDEGNSGEGSNAQIPASLRKNRS